MGPDAPSPPFHPPQPRPIHNPEISENAPDVVIEYTYSATTVSTERSTLSIVLRSANADGVGQALGNLGLRSVIPRDRAPFT